MADISMCVKTKCPSKLKCLRYTAMPSPYWQSYGLFRIKKGQKKCEHFLSNKGETLYRN